MGYAEELVRLLRPLGVYSFREGSFSLGELQALGGALDAAQAKLSRMQRESIPATAEDEGLDRMEALFRYCAGLKDTQARRAAIAAFCSSAATALRCRRSTGACRHAAFLPRGGDGKAGACAGVVSEADGRPGRLCADARHH